MEMYLLISLFANLILMVFLLVFMYSVYLHDKQFDKDRKSLHLDATRSIEDAHKRAKEIIEHSVDRAKDTLLKSEYIRQDIITDLEKNLNDVSDATVKMVREEALAFNKEYRTLLETMQVEHAKMLEEARSALKEVEYLKKEFTSDIQQEVKDVLTEARTRITQETDTFDSEYHAMLEETKKEYTRQVGESLRKLESIPDSALTEFEETLKKESVSAHQLFETRVKALYASAEKEVAAYKQARMKEVENQLQSLTGSVMEEVIGKKLSRSDHETLVMKSLEKAKADGVIGIKVAPTNPQS